mgnify:CR=1 FL=1
MLDREDLYKKCVEFHGHSCGGLLVGFRAALCAMERFGLDGRAQDEELVCVAENDACASTRFRRCWAAPPARGIYLPSARQAGVHVL